MSHKAYVLFKAITIQNLLWIGKGAGESASQSMSSMVWFAQMHGEMGSRVALGETLLNVSIE
jgi:hypothetical protein